MLKYKYMISFFIVIQLFGLVLFVSTCSTKDDASIKDEEITSFEVFIQGMGLNALQAAFNSDGSYLISSGSNGTTIWDIEAKKELITVFKNEAHSSAISKSGRYLITFSPADHGIIKVCDLTSLKIHSLRILSEKRLFKRP